MISQYFTGWRLQEFDLIILFYFRRCFHTA
jgi:hypothetical protein